MINAVGFGSQQTTQTTQKSNGFPYAAVAVGGIGGAVGGYFVPWSKSDKYAEGDVAKFMAADDAKSDLTKITAEDKQADVKTLTTALETTKPEKAETTVIDELFKDNATETELSKVLEKVEGTPKLEKLKRSMIEGADGKIKEIETISAEMKTASETIKDAPIIFKKDDYAIQLSKEADNSITIQPLKPETKEVLKGGTNAVELDKISHYAYKSAAIKTAASKLEKGKDTIILDGKSVIQIKKSDKNVVTVESGTMESVKTFKSNGKKAVALNPKVAGYSSIELKKAKTAADKLKPGEEVTFTNNKTNSTIKIKKSDKGKVTIERGTMKPVRTFKADGKGAVEFSKIKDYSSQIKSFKDAAAKLENGKEATLELNKKTVLIKKSDKGVVTLEHGQMEKVEELVPDKTVAPGKLDDLIKKAAAERADFEKTKALAKELGIDAQSTETTKITKEKAEKVFKATASNISQEVETAFKNIHSLIKKVSAIKVVGFAAAGMLLAGLIASAVGGNKE